MKIYIAGPIKSDPDYYGKFERVEAMLSDGGHQPVNPARNFNPIWNYRQYIDAGLKQLMTCEAIYMLPGYEHSDGAKLELHYARICGLHVFLDGQTIMDLLRRAREDMDLLRRETEDEHADDQ